MVQRVFGVYIIYFPFPFALCEFLPGMFLPTSSLFFFSLFLLLHSYIRTGKMLHKRRSMKALI